MMPIGKNKTAPYLLTDANASDKQEAYNGIRVNLLARAGLGVKRENAACPVIGVATVCENAGSRHFSANMAISFAKLGLRVLLIDADYHSEGLSPLLGVENKGGVADLVAGKPTEPVQVLLPSLSFLPCGEGVENAADLVGSVAFAGALAAMRSCYDAIFVALPPVSQYADASTAAPALSGIVLGSLPGHDHRITVDRAVQSLKNTGLPIYGMVALS